jgi:hypothetical protein
MSVDSVVVYSSSSIAIPIVVLAVADADALVVVVLVRSWSMSIFLVIQASQSIGSPLLSHTLSHTKTPLLTGIYKERERERDGPVSSVVTS